MWEGGEGDGLVINNNSTHFTGWESVNKVYNRVLSARKQKHLTTRAKLIMATYKFYVKISPRIMREIVKLKTFWITFCKRSFCFSIISVFSNITINRQRNKNTESLLYFKQQIKSLQVFTSTLFFCFNRHFALSYYCCCCCCFELKTKYFLSQFSFLLKTWLRKIS